MDSLVRLGLVFLGMWSRYFYFFDGVLGCLEVLLDIFGFGVVVGFFIRLGGGGI